MGGPNKSIHHTDVPWCVVGGVTILYHTTISMNISVQYQEQTVFGSHGAYAVWTGTDPRSYSVSADMVGANALEVAFNVKQVKTAYDWTQQSPPKCEGIKSTPAASIFHAKVRIESMDSSIPDTTHIVAADPIQISLSMALKECKAI